MTYAPVLLPTLNRFESFRRCIDSLAANNLASNTDIIIALDFPKAKHHWDGYNKILSYISGGISGFRSVKLIRREKNYGAINNFETLVADSLMEYDRVICVFDDMTLSPIFLEYMNKMLELYETDSEVAAVTGYSYPVNWKVADGCNVVKQNFAGSIWGIGYWREKYREMSDYLHRGGLIHDFDATYEAGFPNMTDWAIKDYAFNLCNGYGGNSFLMRMTDIAMRIYLAVECKFFIMPTISKVRNGGFDGGGAFCEKIEKTDGIENSSNYDFDRQPIDSADTFTPLVDEKFDISENRKLLNQFDFVALELKTDALKMAESYHRKNQFERKLLNLLCYFKRCNSFARRVFKKILHK